MKALFNSSLYLGSLATLVTSAALMSAPAHAAVTGTTDFRVTMPEVLVLYHWDDAHLTFSNFEKSQGDETTRSLTDDLGKADYDITGSNLDTTAPNFGSGSNTVNVSLKNAWAVRSIANSTVDLTLAIDNNTLKNVADNSATMTVSNAQLASTGMTGSDSATVTMPSQWTATTGDINFQLDLSNATKPGQYNTRGSGEKGTTQHVFKLSLAPTP